MEIKQAIQALSALAQDTRLEIFRLLVRAGPEGLPAGEIGERLGIAPATLSFHLKELTTAGLIDQHREGRSIVNTLNFETTRRLFAYLLEDCCQGRAELCQPDHAASCGDCAPKLRRKQKSSRKK